MRADNIRTELVFAFDHNAIDDALNERLTELGATEVIDIKVMQETEQEYASALIIFERNKS